MQRLRRLGIWLQRALLRHLRWLRRALGSGRSKLAAAYLVLLALLLGAAIGRCTVDLDRAGVWPQRRVRTPPPVVPAPAGQTWVEVLTTAYCPCPICCGAHADGRTAIMRDVQVHPHGIAVEPKLIPYRTQLFVPGYGFALVDDTGGAMRQSARRGVVHLDLRFRTHQEARNWGVQWHWILLPAETPAARQHGQKAVSRR